ncbi:MAG: peptidoglycan-binding protein [Planctomycetaceae bacterium]
MATSSPLAKARLIPLNANLTPRKDPDHEVTVQFNPETLKLTFSNQVKPSEGGNDGNQPKQVYVQGTTKLALQLWFDLTTAPPPDQPQVNDVRELTSRVAYFITPQDEEQAGSPPPAVRFQWGTFLFDGVMDSLDETLKLFSPDGRPLRAQLSLTLSMQKSLKRTPGPSGSPAATGPGTRPLVAATGNLSLPALASQLGGEGDWRKIATVNGIENPRQLTPGLYLDPGFRR